MRKDILSSKLQFIPPVTKNTESWRELSCISVVITLNYKKRKQEREKKKDVNITKINNYS